MENIFNYENVYFDARSGFEFSALNERRYLENLIEKIKENLGKAFIDFSFYVLFSADPNTVPESAAIEQDNKILFWFSDETGTFPSHITNNYSLIFKCYIKEERGNVFANPLGYVNSFADNCNLTPPKKDIDVFFSGNFNMNRIGLYGLLFKRKFKVPFFIKAIPFKFLRRIVNALKITDLSKDGNVFLFSPKFMLGLAYVTYYNHLLRSKYVLCPRGFKSTETFRHTEALHTGSIVISEKMPDVSIYHGNPFIIYNGLDELNAIFDKIASKEYLENELAEQHKTFYQNNLTIKATALRISNICGLNKY